MESWRPEHSIDDTMAIAEEEGKEPASRTRGRRICPMCELECRKNAWPSLTEAERVAHPNYCTHDKVLMGMKSMHKGSYKGKVGDC
eukprot:12938572-Prorocentrum_lima.AAC.1